MHAFGVHWPLEKCKKPRTGRGFLRIDEGEGKRSFSLYRFLDSLKRRAKVRRF